MKNKSRKSSGWYGDSKGHQRAGKKAAQSVKEKYGDDFHKEVGSLGGETTAKEYGSQFYRLIARATEIINSESDLKSQTKASKKDTRTSL